MTRDNKAILTVEDDQEALNALRMQLERNFTNDYVLEFAQNVDEAISVIDDLVKENIELILLLSDWYMPGKNADVLVNYIKGKNPGVRVIVLSGQLDTSKAGKMLEENVIDRVIMKPWDESNLMNQIKGFLEENS
ncbi:MAG: response regulator [Flavobacteriales bacterium]|jgi:DNA-binding NtrC family response regulator